MKKKYIVKENRDFEDIIRNGKCIKGKNFIVHFKKNDLKYDRFGISVSKKIGNAVIRNKFKRKIRAIIDNNKKDYNNPKDYIIILRGSATERSFQELDNELSKFLKNE